MKVHVINDLNEYPFSDRHGVYGGMAGFKEGLLIDGEHWMIKYPKNTKDLQGPVPSYTSSPLSEYIGSHVYEMLGYEVHETFLGHRNGKVVVACKDVCKNHGDLREIRTLKNAYNDVLEEKLNASFGSTGSSRMVDLDELFIHLEHNPILSKIPGLVDRFWDFVIVDGLINNNDRNNGNWGLLCENGVYRIAPVFDNGGSFSCKVADDRIAQMVASDEKMLSSALNVITIFARDGKKFLFKDLIEEGFQYPEFVCAMKRNVPLIRKKMKDIASFIRDIPEEFHGKAVCSQVRKEFYIKGMELRLKHFLLPAFERATEMKPSLDSVIKECECKRDACVHKREFAGDLVRDAR